MPQPLRRSTRTRKAPQRFADENFQDKNTTESKQVNSSDEVEILEFDPNLYGYFGPDGQEYYQKYDEQGRLWEISLLTGEGILLADNINADSSQSGEKETKEPDTTVTRHTLVIEFRSKQMARKLYQRPFQITENHTLFCPLEFASTKELENLIESHGGSIIYYLNKAINYYKEEVSGTDKFEQFKNKNQFLLDEITIRESYFTPEGKECGEDKIFYPEWGTKKNLMLYGALTFDGATFHFYSDKADSRVVGSNGPQLVISEKTEVAKSDEAKSVEAKSVEASPEKAGEKKVTFAIPHRKEYRYEPYPAEMPLSQFKEAVNTPLPDKNSQDAAETLLTLSSNQLLSTQNDLVADDEMKKKRKKKDKKKKDKNKKEKKKRKSKKKKEKKQTRQSIENRSLFSNQQTYVYKQTYQLFSSIDRRFLSGEQTLYTNTAVSPLSTLADLWCTVAEFEIRENEYLLFQLTDNVKGTSSNICHVSLDRKTKNTRIILYNSQIDYDINNFRKRIWWEFGTSFKYTIEIVQDMDKAIRRATLRSITLS